MIILLILLIINIGDSKYNIPCGEFIFRFIITLIIIDHYLSYGE